MTTKNTVMNKETLLNYLRRNKEILNISGIGRAAGFTKLRHAVNGNKDGHGTVSSIPEKYIQPINDVIAKLQLTKE